MSARWIWDANEARSAEVAITSLISNKREWNNCFIKFLKLRKLEVRNTSEKSEKIRAKSRNELDEDAMLCNTLCSERRRLVTKNLFLPFHVLLNVDIDPNFAQKSFFSFLALFREKLRFPAKTFLA